MSSMNQNPDEGVSYPDVEDTPKTNYHALIRNLNVQRNNLKDLLSIVEESRNGKIEAFKCVYLELQRSTTDEFKVAYAEQICKLHIPDFTAWANSKVIDVENKQKGITMTQKIIIEMLKSTGRKGMDDLVEHLIQSGFFVAPASTRFHGCYSGGLADHSLRVCELLSEHNNRFDLGKVDSAGQKPLPLTDENITIAALLHDVCKIGAYIGTEKPYKWNRQQPKGHALLSIERIKGFIELEPIEELIIKYHMGFYGLNEFYEEGGWQSGEYPLRGDHSKDEGMSKEESQVARYGKSFANAIYHNPICKMMYFCDEIATMEEKASETVGK